MLAAEYRPSSLHAQDPRIAAQGWLDTRQGYLAQFAEDHGQRLVLVDVANPDSYSQDGFVRTFYWYDNQAAELVRQEMPSDITLPPFDAWRLRSVLLPGGDPAAFPGNKGFNGDTVRRRLANRLSVSQLLGELGIHGDHRIPEARIFDYTVDVPFDQEYLLIKPPLLSDVTRDNINYRAQLVRNDEMTVSQLVTDLGGQALVQPRMPTMAPAELLGALGQAPPDERVPADSLHAVCVYDVSSLPAPEVVEIRHNNPRNNIGKLYATRSDVIEAGRVFEAFPSLAGLHRQVRHRLKRAFDGEHFSMAMKYILAPDGAARIVIADGRAFTPDITCEDAHRQALSRLLAQREGELLLELAG